MQLRMAPRANESSAHRVIDTQRNRRAQQQGRGAREGNRDSGPRSGVQWWCRRQGDVIGNYDRGLNDK
jgi:hypothetical protein